MKGREINRNRRDRDRYHALPHFFLCVRSAETHPFFKGQSSTVGKRHDTPAFLTPKLHNRWSLRATLFFALAPRELASCPKHTRDPP